MLYSAFQLNKVRRLVRVHGIVVNIKTPGVNDFGEPTEDASTIEIKGVFHESTSYVSKGTSEASTTKKKSSPMLLCLWEDSQGIKPLLSKATLNGKTYDVNGITNLGEANLIVDISLEEVQTSG